MMPNHILTIDHSNTRDPSQRNPLAAVREFANRQTTTTALMGLRSYLIQGSTRPVIGKDPYLIATPTICLPLTDSTLRVQYSPTR